MNIVYGVKEESYKEERGYDALKMLKIKRRDKRQRRREEGYQRV